MSGHGSRFSQEKDSHHGPLDAASVTKSHERIRSVMLSLVANESSIPRLSCAPPKFVISRESEWRRS